MSLGIAFKGPEGVVLAADSRVTLMGLQPNLIPGQAAVLVPATFDNATKLLRLKGQERFGAVTYGLGAIGQLAPRTAHSFIPEFEANLAKEKAINITVEQFATRLSEFFSSQWKILDMPVELPQGTPEMTFLIGGYDPEAPYGRVFEFSIPTKPKPHEWFTGPGQFGIVWGGQREFVDRLIQGYDPRVIDIVASELHLEEKQTENLREKLGTLSTPVPYQFLPLQDCVDLSIFLLRTTIRLQTWTVGIRGVGGAIDVAVITKTDGFQPVRLKQLSGEEIV
jgi:hypothetical protein